MKQWIFAASFILAAQVTVRAQDTSAARPLTMEEYEKARTFSVADLDKDTYVKFDNAYILDHNGFGKPYFITGDDGKRKRIDLYELIRKTDRAEIGTVIYYTTENGKRYTACMPGYRADPLVWKKYFEDIHAIEKEESNFVLKLSYVLSKELGYQLYRSMRAGQGAVDRSESGTYGNDICFPGDMEVTMAGGTKKPLSEVKPGDAVLTVDPVTHAERPVTVKELTKHAVKNYAITRLLLVSAEERGEGGQVVSAAEKEETGQVVSAAEKGETGQAVSATEKGEWGQLIPAVKQGAHEIALSSRTLEATPNHPMGDGKTAGELNIGDRVWCSDGKGYKVYTVWDKSEAAGGMQRVYNIVAAGGSTFVMNDVLVMQKAARILYERSTGFCR